MKIEMTQVPWWNGYQTWMIIDPPNKPDKNSVRELLDWSDVNLHSIFLPAPFLEFTDRTPWRHLMHLRWDACIAALSPDAMQKSSFVDIGGNTGYYAFLAKALGADRSVLLDEWIEAVEFARRLDNLYGVGIETHCQRMEDYDWDNFDIAFSFSALPYLGQKNFQQLKDLLKTLSGKINTFFIEMGDGGSALDKVYTLEEQEALFVETGWKVDYLGTTWASHSNTDRPLWKLTGHN